MSRSKKRRKQNISARQSPGLGNAGPGRTWLPVVLVIVAVAGVVLYAIFERSEEPKPRSDAQQKSTESQALPLGGAIAKAPAQTAAETSTDQAATVPLMNPRSWQQMDNPALDGWETEAFHEKAKKQLEKLGELMIRPGPALSPELAPLVVDSFSCGPLLPESIKTVYEDQAIVVQRGALRPLNLAARRKRTLAPRD